MTLTEAKKEYISKCIIGQSTLHGFDKYNLVVDANEGVFYTVKDNLDGIKPNILQCYDDGMLNTNNLPFDTYWETIYLPFITANTTEHKSCFIYISTMYPDWGANYITLLDKLCLIQILIYMKCF